MATTMDSAPNTVGGSHPSLPASPTLTNPDMILPDYDRSPSPGGLDDPLHSPLSMWRDAHARQQAPENADGLYSAQAQQFHGFSGVVSPTTPIIYGNGTMLSDIGEVTEAESTLGKPSPPRQRHGVMAAMLHGPKSEDSEGDAALRSSPTIGTDGAPGGVKKRAKAAQRERRSSIDSNSTITGDRDQTPVFVDFDDTVSVGDSVFQGDDEESLASSYLDDSSLADGPALASPGLNRDAGQKYTTAQLSRRAEQILANAKKRLTHMEDKLTRARSSLGVGSPYSGSNTSSPSPPVSRASTALILSTTGTGQLSPASGHHRIGSDHSLRIGLPIKVYSKRSSSGLGVSTAPLHQVLTVSKSADQLNGQYNRQRTSYIMHDASLEPLSEDDVSQPFKRTELNIPITSPAISSPTFGDPADRGLSRSASTSQMRDIKDQVMDLKGKISSLREQARADSMKRRSLQTLRTPSPFTHARMNQWYASTTGDSEGQSQDSSAEISPWNGDTTSGDSTRDEVFDALPQIDHEEDSPVDAPVVSEEAYVEDADQFRDNGSGLSPYEGEVDVGDDNEDMLTENGDVEEGMEPEYVEAIDDGYDVVSESGESIYHESVQNPISHEDREDAFDYEHFFLHSAIGTISQRLARRDSYASFSSQDSVETTRGPVVEESVADQQHPPTLTRRGSDTSISTTETFATAEEGVSSRHGSLDLNRTKAGDEEEDQFEQEPFPVLYGPNTPPTAKRATFAGIGTSPFAASSRPEGMHSAIRRPMSSSGTTRPYALSVSSVASSTGTTRSFPLVNRHGKSGSSGIPTLEGGWSDPDLKTSSGLGIRNGTAIKGEQKTSISLHSIGSATSLIEGIGTTAVMETLPRDDQYLVERLVASLGRCVLGLTESVRGSTEARMYRQRIDAARRILEGLDSV